MERIELLLPAGDKESLRAAVHNGADAVYLGLDAFNARRFADNFHIENLPSVVQFCHKNNVRVFVTANILVKNHEMKDFFNLIKGIDKSGADAIIIQDPWLIPLIRANAPNCEIHLSTQATTNNKYAIPEGADRVIVPRELNFNQISEMAKIVPLEMFVHGALCLSYSGQCLFSSIAGARSGNRGKCAQPCRQKYNGKYELSTMDLCLLEKIPEIIETGVVSLKVEGRMRGPLYTGTVARIYRKYIDMHYAGNFNVDNRDIEELKMAFNRGFTTGFAFNESVVDSGFAMNRGVYLGIFENGGIVLEAELRVGDGVMALHNGVKTGNTIQKIKMHNKYVDRAEKGDAIAIHVKGARNGDNIYKTFSVGFQTDLGPDFSMEETNVNVSPVKLPKIHYKNAFGEPALFVKVHNIQDAKEADDSGASIIYYDIFAWDCQAVAKALNNARFFLSTPRIMSAQEVDRALKIIETVKPDGVLVGARGLLSVLGKKKLPVDIHLDQSLNVFNDIDIDACGGTPIISPELTFDEISQLKSTRFVVMAHGPLVLMTTREPIRQNILRDERGRRFPTRKTGDVVEVLNCSDLGLFNMVRSYLDIGIKWFYLEPASDIGKIVGIYNKIISNEPFDDRKIRKGYTTGHFRRGVD